MAQIHRHVVVRRVSAADDFAGDDFLLVLALHHEIDRLALSESSKDSESAIILLEHLNRMFAARITQNDRIRLQLHGDICHLNFVRPRLQGQRQFLANDSEFWL